MGVSVDSLACCFLVIVVCVVQATVLADDVDSGAVKTTAVPRLSQRLKREFLRLTSSLHGKGVVVCFHVAV